MSNNLVIEPFTIEPLNKEFSELQCNSTKNSVPKTSLMMDSSMKEYLTKLNSKINLSEDSKEDKTENLSIKKFLELKKMIYSKPENTKFKVVNNAPPNTKNSYNKINRNDSKIISTTHK